MDPVYAPAACRTIFLSIQQRSPSMPVAEAVAEDKKEIGADHDLPNLAGVDHTAERGCVRVGREGRGYPWD